MQGSTSGFLEVVYNSRLSNVGNTSQLNTRLLMSQRWWGRDIDTPGKNPWLVSKNIRSQINKHSLVPMCILANMFSYGDTIEQSEASILAMSQSQALLWHWWLIQPWFLSRVLVIIHPRYHNISHYPHHKDHFITSSLIRAGTSINLHVSTLSKIKPIKPCVNVVWANSCWRLVAHISGPRLTVIHSNLHSSQINLGSNCFMRLTPGTGSCEPEAPSS